MTDFIKLVDELDTCFKTLGLFQDQGPFRVTKVSKDSSDSAVIVEVYGVDPGEDLHLHSETWQGDAWVFRQGKVTCQVHRLPKAVIEYTRRHRLPNGF